MKYTASYLVTIQFLGFRFHGWQKQTDVKTVHDMVDKTLSFVFETREKVYKTLGAGRTDSKVSAATYALQLFTYNPVELTTFIQSFNLNAPPDIKALSIKQVSTAFNIIQAPKTKEYHYYFSFGEKQHPFAAPFMVGVPTVLDIELMQEAARLFEGTHHFHKYCTKPSEKTVFKRTIEHCVIEENTVLTASFFPKKTYVLKVRGAGFLRYQIRLMMGVLFDIGIGEKDLKFVKESLQENNDQQFLRNIAPSSGLQLFAIDFTA